jgi:hypothetical protein
VRHRRAVLGLTAGGDSRMMLACARPFRDRLGLYTLSFDDVTGRTDVITAAKLAKRVGLTWGRYGWVEATSDEILLWLYRTGAIAGEPRGRRSAPTYAQLAGDEKPIRISGLGVELSRGYARDRGLRPGEPPDTAEKPLTAEDLLARMSLVRDPLLAEEAERWRDGLPELDALDTIDLCALETTHGAWAGSVTLGHPDAFVTTIYPFATRAILDAVFGLPHEYRSGDRLRRDVGARRWPELFELPINAIPRRVAFTDRVSRVAELPGRAARRSRRLLAS